MTPQELGQRVKAKYPSYQNIDDAELGRKVSAKYPQYKIEESNPNVPEKMGVLGNVFTRPGAAVREGVRKAISSGHDQDVETLAANFGRGFTSGAMQPSQSETFQKEAIRKELDPQNPANVADPIYQGISKLPEGPQTAALFARGIPASVAGMTQDTVSNPAEMAMTALGMKYAPSVANSSIGKALGVIMNKKITPIKSTKNAIKSAIKYPSKLEQAVGKDITPKASQAIFENTVGLPDTEVARIKSTYSGSVSPLADKIKSGIKSKVDSAGKSFEKAWDSLPDDAKVNPQLLQDYLNKEIPGLEATLGKEHPITNSFRSILDNTYRQPTLEESMVGGAGQRLTRELSKMEAGSTRDSLNKLMGADPNINRLISGAKNSLYESVGKSGMVGLDDARSAYRAAKTNEERYLNEYGDLRIPESRLEKLGLDSMNKQDIDNLKELETFLGDPFIDEASKINKIREFEAEFRPEVLETKLKQVQKGEKFQLGENLKTVMGPKADLILKELSKNKNQKRGLAVGKGVGITALGTGLVGMIARALGKGN